MLATIEEGEEAGFAVGEDLTVKEKYASPLMRVSAARQQQVQSFATEIASRAKRLVAMDQASAAKINESLAPLAKLSFEETPAANDNATHVQAVDHHFKQSPDPAPVPPPLPRSEHGPVETAAGRQRGR